MKHNDHKNQEYKLMYEAEKKKNELLQEENQELRNRIEKETKKNNRGAGRKPKLAMDEQEMVVYQYQCGRSMGELAKEYKVSKGTIHKIIKNPLGKEKKD